jgi:hypothetical protein
MAAADGISAQFCEELAIIFEKLERRLLKASCLVICSVPLTKGHQIFCRNIRKNLRTGKHSATTLKQFRKEMEINQKVDGYLKVRSQVPGDVYYILLTNREEGGFSS